MGDMIAKAEALAPCPFCGGEATFSEGKTGDGKPWHYVECSECEAMGPGVSYADHNIAVKSVLADAWNRRAAAFDIDTFVLENSNE